MPRGDISAVGTPRERRLKCTSQAIIINNTFETVPNNELMGYKKDEANILKTFKPLNIEFEVKRNLKGRSMLPEIIRWMQTADFDDVDCVLCFILTHGKEGGLLLGEDMGVVEVSEIKKQFIENEDLKGVPKLFFIQACRGAKDAEAVKLPPGIEHASLIQKAKEADVFMLFPTTETHVSWVSPDKGSVFIRNLCNVVHAYGGDYHLGDIVTKVNELISREVYEMKDEDGETVTIVEMPEATHSMTYNLYFNGGC